MIRIPNKDILSNKKAFLEDVLERFIDFLVEKNNSDPSNYSIFFNYFSDDGTSLSKEKLSNLICGDINELKKITNDLESLYSKSGQNFKESVLELTYLYDKFSTRKIAYTWPDTIGVRVCPYCNRNYVFSIPRKRVRPEYDHYFPKSLYPHLCVSMFNLIPSCGMCNRFKSDDDPVAERIIYPFSEGFDNDVVFEATVKGNNISDLLDLNKKLSVEMKCSNPSTLTYSLDYSERVFRLPDLYKKHSDVAEDIRKLSLIYTKDYIDSLIGNYSWLNNSHDTLDILYLNKLDKKDWIKRPLSKFTHDLIKQFQR